MEKEKDNKGLIIGIVIFLSLCLIAVFYFMFKMTYIENKTTNNEKEQTQTETEDNNEVIFTELTKYTLEEGEEKEIIVDEKTIKVKFENGTYYLNEKSMDLNSGIYVTNNLIISYGVGQYGETYKFYDVNLNEINVEQSEDCFVQYNNIRLENQLLLVDNIDNFDNFSEKVCRFGTYKIAYYNNKISYEFVK